MRVAISVRKSPFSLRSAGTRPMCGRKFLSKTDSAFLNLYSSTCPGASLFPRYSSASLWLVASRDFSNDPSSSFWIGGGRVYHFGFFCVFLQSPRPQVKKKSDIVGD